MAMYRLQPEAGAPVLRWSSSLAKATSNGLREFPAGLRSVAPVDLPELARLAAEGVPLPVAARQRLAVYKAVQREQVKAAAKVQAIREAVRDKAREAVRIKREEEQARKDAEKAQRRAEKAAEKRRKVLAERKAMKAQEAAQPVAAVAPGLVVDPSDTRLPWE